EHRLSHYRDRCLNCHQENRCALPLDVRRKQNQDDSCIACHMPRFESSDIAHTAVTDHHILRKQGNAERGQRKPRRLRSGEIPLVNFFEKELDPRDPAVSRDLGLALIYLAAQPIPGREALGPVALARLEKGLHSLPEDAAAWEAKGRALSLQGGKTE